MALWHLQQQSLYTMLSLQLLWEALFPKQQWGSLIGGQRHFLHNKGPQNEKE